MDDPVLEALRQSGKLSDDDFRFLRDFGQRYRAQRLPSGLKRQKSGACLDVADQLEREGRGRVRARLRAEPYRRTPRSRLGHSQ